MKSFIQRFLFFILSVVLLFVSRSEAQDYNFRNIGINEGLPSPRVYAVTQGKNGFMYFGTADGLVRYDGERMKLFHHINGDSTSIPVNKVKSLLTDRNGNILCGHDKLGVSFFNPSTEKFKTIAFKNSKHEAFTGIVNHLYQNANGNIYACTIGISQGMFVIDDETNTAKQFLPTEHDPFGMLTKSNDNIIDLNFYSDTLWLLGSANGLIFYNPVKNHVWKCLKITNTNKDTWLNYIDGVVIDKKKNFYFGSWWGGLHYYNFKTNTVETYTKTETYVTINANAPKYFINDSILLINSWDLFFFNTNSKKITRISPDILNKYSFAGRSSDAYRAPDSSIWISTLTGVSYFNPDKNEFKTKILFKADEWLNVNPTVEFCWICYDQFTNSYIINYRDAKVMPYTFHLAVYDERFNHLYDLPHQLTNNTSGFLYAGNYKGKVFFSGDIKGAQKIMMLDLNTKKISEPFSKFQHLDSMQLDGMFLNHDTLYAIAMNKKTILKFNSNNYELISEMPIQKDADINYYYYNSQLQFDVSRNVFWIGTENGIYKLSSLTGEIIILKNDSINQLLKQNSKVTALSIDKENKLWFGFQNGLIRYDAETNKVIKFLNEKYLPSLNSYNLFCDESGYIWSDCSKGIMRIDPVSYIVQLFNSNNGLQPFSYPARTDFMSNGNLVIPFAGGLVLYDTHKHDVETKPVLPVITSLKNFDKEIFTDTAVTELSLLTIPFQSNSITIEFAALNFSNASFTQYAYKLDGLSGKFIYTTIPTITYNNLLPDNYILHLKSSWDGKSWSDERILQITITPPWYRTWWFRSLILLISIALVVLVYRYREIQIRKQEKLKAGFRNQLMEMEMTALRSQMNPHFIFNSLNSINRYVMQNDRLTASEYIAKFGKLIRNVLDNSRSDSITLQQELSTLELYIEMEKLRFEEKFDYKIIVGDDVDVNSINIPPLLIQPFVENSIWHGLMHKDEKGFVTVEAKMKSEHLLQISVEDNGVGRAKAAELKSKKTSHQSHGLKVTAERIKIINEIYKQENKIEAIDLFDENKNASGTRVVLLMSV